LLFEGQWQPGARVAYRFELEAPLGPLSYTGKLLNVSWCVRAIADLVWADDAEAARDFSLERWRAGELLPSQAGYRSGARSPPADYVFGSQPPRPKPLLDPSDDTAVPFEGAVLGLGRAVRNVWARMRLGGGPEIQAPAEIAAGEVLRVRIVPPDGARGPDSVVVRLIAQEVIQRRGFDDPRLLYLEHALAYFDDAEAVRAETEWIAELAIPPGAAPTFCGGIHDLRYGIQIECKAEGAPAWHRALPLIVRPPRAQSTSARNRSSSVA
jgi:hypothetical protein